MYELRVTSHSHGLPVHSVGRYAILYLTIAAPSVFRGERGGLSKLAPRIDMIHLHTCSPLLTTWKLLNNQRACQKGPHHAVILSANLERTSSEPRDEGQCTLTDSGCNMLRLVLAN